MRTLETDAEIHADGSVKFLSPLPDWLKPGRRHVLLVVEETTTETVPLPSEESLLDAFKRLRVLGTFGGIDDPVAWQREIREEHPLPGRD